MNDSLNADPKLIDQNHSSSFGGWTMGPQNRSLLRYKDKKNKQTKKKQKTKNKKTKTNEKAQLVLLKLRNYPVVSSDQAILDITVHIDP